MLLCRLGTATRVIAFSCHAQPATTLPISCLLSVVVTRVANRHAAAIILLLLLLLRLLLMFGWMHLMVTTKWQGLLCLLELMILYVLHLRWTWLFTCCINLLQLFSSG
jgi:hypothetical protein